MAAITSYLDIISLERARIYLRVDDTMNEDDSEIESMIKGAFLFMERYTNHIFMPKDFLQYADGTGMALDNDFNHHCGYVSVYKYPINSTVDDVLPVRKFNMKWIYNVNELDFNAGYDDTDQIPDDFIQAALQIIKVWYFEAEKEVNDTMIPVSVRQVLDTYRRFV